MNVNKNCIVEDVFYMKDYNPYGKKYQIVWNLGIDYCKNKIEEGLKLDKDFMSIRVYPSDNPYKLGGRYYKIWRNAIDEFENYLYYKYIVPEKQKINAKNNTIGWTIH